MTTGSIGTTPGEIGARADLEDGEDLGPLAEFGNVAFPTRRGRRNLWIVAAIGGRDVAALGAGFSAGDLTTMVQSVATESTIVYEFTSSLGAMRTKVAFPAEECATIRCTSSLLPARDVVVSWWPRDLYPIDAPEGTVHTVQRGLRGGIVFASAQAEQPSRSSTCKISPR